MKTRGAASGIAIWWYKMTHPCVDCGNADPIVLDFDHVNGNKRKSVSSMRAYSLKTILKEIQKCEVVCSNCHRKRTYARLPEGQGQHPTP